MLLSAASQQTTCPRQQSRSVVGCAEPGYNSCITYITYVHASRLQRVALYSTGYSGVEQPQHAGYEPVCLVPGSVDKYLHVPDCTLQQSLDTHAEGFLLC